MDEQMWYFKGLKSLPQFTLLSSARSQRTEGRAWQRGGPSGRQTLRSASPTPCNTRRESWLPPSAPQTILSICVLPPKQKLRAYGCERNSRIIGELTIYVAHHSADV